MKIILIFLFVVSFGLAQTITACTYEARNNVAFNIGLDFYTVRVDGFRRRVPFGSAKIEGTVERSGDMVYVRINNLTRIGKLHKRLGCTSSPSYVVWNATYDNPSNFGRYLEDRFWKYSENAKVPIRSFVKGYLTVLIDEESKREMEKERIYIVKNDMGVTLNTPLSQLDLEGVRKEYEYVTIQVIRPMGSPSYAKIIWRERSGKMFVTRLDLKTKQMFAIP